jgi:5-methylcytosine-specific restriction endonuclease McrA
VFRKKIVSFRNSNGTARIKRDTYGGLAWYDIIARVNARDGKVCSSCPETAHLHVHHIKPLSKGGLTVLSNLILLCERCHARRHRHMG